MKRLLSVLMALVLFCALPLSAMAQTAAGSPAMPESDAKRTNAKPVEKIDAFTLSSSFAFTTETRTTEQSNIDLLTQLLQSGAQINEIPKGTEIARLKIEQGDKSSKYKVIRHPQGSIYLSGDDRSQILHTDHFYRLASEVNGFYTYREIPVAELEQSRAGQAAVTQSNYAFKKLDGQYYRTQYNSGYASDAYTEDGSLVLPVFSLPILQADVTVERGGKQIFSGTWEQAKAYRLQGSGDCLVTVKARFDNQDYRGNVTYQYTLTTIDKSAPTFSVAGESTNPGELLVLRAIGVPAGESVQVSTDIDFKPVFHSDGAGGQIALMPVSYFTAPGEHYIQLTAGGKTEKYGVSVQNKQFQIQHLTVGQSTTEQTIASQKANQEFRDKFLSLRWNDSSAKLWNGQCILPVEDARVTTQFGCIRYTNGSSNADRHGGVDLAAPTGTTVKATNDGTVLFAGYLQLTGNSILLEHGYGMKSWYYHMDSVSVKAGDSVKKGQKIGEVGSTGFSTGPHLHFAMSVNNVFINPYTLINSDVLTTI